MPVMSARFMGGTSLGGDSTSPPATPRRNPSRGSARRASGPGSDLPPQRREFLHQPPASRKSPLLDEREPLLGRLYVARAGPPQEHQEVRAVLGTRPVVAGQDL